MDEKQENQTGCRIDIIDEIKKICDPQMGTTFSWYEQMTLQAAMHLYASSDRADEKKCILKAKKLVDKFLEMKEEAERG